MDTLKRSKYSGSFTVEAAFVMPVVLGIILLILYLCIYTHDKAVMEYAAIKACERCCEEAKKNKDEDSGYLTGLAREQIEEITDKGLIGNWDEDVKVSFEGEEIKASIYGRMGNSQGLMESILQGKIFSIRVSCKEVLVNEYEWIRAR